MRTCPACRRHQPLTTEYHRDTHGRDGYSRTCRSCRNAAARLRFRTRGPGIPRRRYEPATVADTIDRAVNGWPVDELSVAERTAVVVALTARGMRAWLIAERLATTKRTVVRYRRRARQVAA